MTPSAIDTLAARAIVPLRVVLAALILALATLVWYGNAIATGGARTEARLDAYLTLAMTARDTLIARFVQIVSPTEAGTGEMLGRAEAIDAAVARARAVATGPDETGAVEELERIARRLRALTDGTPSPDLGESYAAGQGGALAARFIGLSDALVGNARQDHATSLRQRAAMRRATNPILIGVVVVVLLLIAATIRKSYVNARAAEAARLVPRIEAQRDRADLLAQELRHRVQNLFAVVASIVTSSAREPGTQAEVASRTRGRIEALARAHALSGGGESDLGGLDLTQAVRELALPVAPSPERLSVAGEAISMDPAAATPLGLVVNELATNAVKHGAWSVPDGTVDVRVERPPEGGARIVWTERGGPPVPTPSAKGGGFGSRMIEMSVAQLGARMEREAGSDGLRVRVDLPPDRGADGRG